jgi:VanZ family protein
VAWSRIWRWAPVLLWFFVISSFSTDAFSAEETGAFLLPILRLLFPRMSEAGLDALHIALRKAGHVTEFGILALLAYRALAWGRSGWQGRAAAATTLLTIGLALVDETHQALTASREASVTDVGWDALGGLAALGGLRLICSIREWIRRRGRTQGALSRNGVEVKGKLPNRPQDGGAGRP